MPSGLSHYANARLEPLTLLSALAAVTEHIGLMATASTSYNEPYNLARYFASLDFLSNGRASWNVVTSWLEEEAANFGLEQLPATAPATSGPMNSSTWSLACGILGRWRGNL